MKTALRLLLVASFLFLVTPIRAGKTATEIEKLEGTWAAIAYVQDGQGEGVKILPAQSPIRWVFKGARFTILADVEDAHIKGSFKLDPATKPRTIDIHVPGPKGGKDDQTMLGIYEVEGDTLKLCYGPDKGKRPAEFKSAAGSKNILIVFQRRGLPLPTQAEQERAIIEIEKLGGKVIVDRRKPGQSVSIVSLNDAKMSNEGLIHLQAFPQLPVLYLNRATIDDGGLKHLKDLADLKTLDLSYTKITDAGLTHLKGLKKLEVLQLAETQVSDAGLTHLKVLTTLRELNLLRTKVTDKGVKELQKALPNARLFFQTP